MFVWGRNARARCGSLVTTNKCLERLPGIEGSQCSDSLGIHCTTNARYFYRVWGRSEQSLCVGSWMGCVAEVAEPRVSPCHWPVGPALRRVGLWAQSRPAAHIRTCCHACSASPESWIILAVAWELISEQSLEWQQVHFGTDPREKVLERNVSRQPEWHPSDNPANNTCI